MYLNQRRCLWTLVKALPLDSAGLCPRPAGTLSQTLAGNAVPCTPNFVAARKLAQFIQKT